MLSVVRRTRARKRAFTLLEVIIVIVIIGLLAAFVGPQLFNVLGNQKVKLAQAAVDSGFNGTITAFRASTQRYPKDLKELTLDKPETESEAKSWPGRLIEDPTKLKDPWDHEYIYVYPGTVNTTSYDLSSPGPDGVAGNDDDITNWKRQ